MKAVNVKTQTQWDIVSKELGYKWPNTVWNNYQDRTCIRIDLCAFGDISTYKELNATILTFNEWLLEHCREKYKGNPKVKGVDNVEKIFQIDSNTIHHDFSIWALELNVINSWVMLCDYNTFQFAEIITESQPEQREIVGYAAPMNMFGGEVEKDEPFIICHHTPTLYVPEKIKKNSSTYYSVPKELVESTWQPIYKKTEAEEQAEIWDEFFNDWEATNNDDTTIETYVKQQTKFKIVRNENN